MEPTENTIKVPTAVFGIFTERLNDITKKARRLGTPEPTVNIINTFTRTETDENGIHRTTHWTEFTVDAEAPKLEGGWKFVAAVEHYEVGNIVRVAPDFREEEMNLTNVQSFCDHCGTRRSRKMTLVLQDENGDRKRVGSACVKDYLGHNIPNVWAIWNALEELTNDFDEDGCLYFLRNNTLDVHAACAIAAQITLTNGFKPSSWGHESTKEQVFAIMNPSPYEKRDAFTLTDEAKTIAAEAYAWLMANGVNSDYMNNLRVAFQVCDKKHLGLIVSLPAAYMKDRDKKTAEATIKELPTAPCVLGKTTITGQVVKAYMTENDYGTRYVMVVRDDRGFSVWGTVPSAINVNIGDTVRFNATVEASDKPEFGFFKRPTKAEVLTLAVAQ